MLKIAKISAVDTFSLRISVLRKGKNLVQCPFEGDDLSSTIHLGAFLNDNLIGIISVFEVKFELLVIENQFQIRGMAISGTHQNQGVGKFLVEEAENYIKKENGNLIWMNARESAVGFYKKLNYSVQGPIFEIEGIGNHYKMTKYL